MNPMKDVEGVMETRFLTYEVYISMGNNSVKALFSPIIKQVHLRIIGRRSIKFQMNLTKDVEEVMETSF